MVFYSENGCSTFNEKITLNFFFCITAYLMINYVSRFSKKVTHIWSKNIFIQVSDTCLQTSHGEENTKWSNVIYHKVTYLDFL